MDFETRNITLNHAAMLAGWATPAVSNTHSGHESRAAKTDRINLNDQVLLAGWQTPTASAGIGAGPTTARTRHGRPVDRTFERLDYTAEQGLIGSTAAMDGGGRLNPDLARWLMRLPPVWSSCAVTAMPSTRKRSPNS